tara:strand:+ start:703 stop:894 length:192 start_codon:yes stop_codon:yes gene_type:complete
LYIFDELLEKHPAAMIIKIVVGKPGITIPRIPRPRKKIPAMKYKILIILISYLRIFEFKVNYI